MKTCQVPFREAWRRLRNSQITVFLSADASLSSRLHLVSDVSSPDISDCSVGLLAVM